MTGRHQAPAPSPDPERLASATPAAQGSATMREAWVQWAVAMLEEE